MDRDLAITTQLIDSINRHDIEYCHWKSNITLSNALTGGEDLDILVDRKALPRFVAILLDLGFKLASIKSGDNVPGIYHYYGLDSETGKLSHIHLYNYVVTGESFVKSHFLPIEKMLLENPDHISNVRVASRSAELVLFILRIFIKYGSLLDLIRLARHPDAVLAELRWLQAGADLSESLALLDKYCPVIDETLFLKGIEILGQPNSLLKRMLLAYTIRRRLNVYTKYTRLERLFAYVKVLWVRQKQRFIGRRKNKTPNTGGAIIAFVGADATGKSTLVAETGRWLGSVFATQIVHVGKPPSTWLTLPLRIILPLMRRLLPHLRRDWVSNKARTLSPAAGHAQVSLIYAVRAVALAWDRYRLLVKVRRWAANGNIIVCDRYPTETLDAMDSPRLQEHPASHGIKTQLYNYLARQENRIYKQMPPPDIVLKLKVSIETAKQRNRDRIEIGMDDEDYLEARHLQAGNWQKHGTKYSYDIDTEMSLAETILTVKRSVWEAL
jgi:thymidylate kinase